MVFFALRGGRLAALFALGECQGIGRGLGARRWGADGIEIRVGQVGTLRPPDVFDSERLDRNPLCALTQLGAALNGERGVDDCSELARNHNKASNMPAPNRSAGRNVHIYDASDPISVLGGLALTNGITNANFYAMIDILFLFGSTFFLRDEGGNAVERNGQALQPGKYYIVAASEFCGVLAFTLLTYAQSPSQLITSPVWSARFLPPLGPVLSHSVMMSASEMADV